MTYRQPRQELEARLISEYCSNYYPTCKVIYRAWIGKTPPEAQQAEQDGFNPAMYQVTGKWIDAIVEGPDFVTLIEAKYKLRPEALGQMIIYKDMFMQTDQYSHLHNKKINLLVVYGIPDEETIKALQTHQIATIRYYPEWLQLAHRKRITQPYQGGK